MSLSHCDSYFVQKLQDCVRTQASTTLRKTSTQNAHLFESFQKLVICGCSQDIKSSTYQTRKSGDGFTTSLHVLIEITSHLETAASWAKRVWRKINFVRKFRTLTCDWRQTPTSFFMVLEALFDFHERKRLDPRSLFYWGLLKRKQSSIQRVASCALHQAGN